MKTYFGYHQHMMISTLMIIRQVHLRGLPGPERLNGRALGFSLPKRHLAPRLTSMQIICILLMTMILFTT